MISFIKNYLYFFKFKSIVEIKIVLKFITIGGLSAILHLLSLFLIIKNTSLGAIFANMIAFLIAILFSFTGNYIWTFGSEEDILKALKKFLLISTLAFFINSIFFIALMYTKLFLPLITAILSGIFTAIFTFIFCKHWVFRLTKI